MNEIARRILGMSSVLSFKARDAVAVVHGNVECCGCSHRLWLRIPINGARRSVAKTLVSEESLRKLIRPASTRQFLDDIYDPCIDDDDDDDETASTLSTADDDSSCGSSLYQSGSSDTQTAPTSRRTVVSFDTPLVTAIYFRPYTTLSEKRILYYTDVDYREFRRDYFYRPARDRVVQFMPTLVTAVYSIPLASDPTALHYSDTDLQGFLDEFVASLSKKT